MTNNDIENQITDNKKKIILCFVYTCVIILTIFVAYVLYISYV